MGDTRRDSGEYYPGGKVIPRQPVTPGGGADPNAVHYTADRNKTEAEKAQARANLGLANVAASGDYGDLKNRPDIPPAVTLDDDVTQTSSNGVKSSGIWAWVKSLLPSWLTAESEEPRGKTDLDVYGTKQVVEWSDFTDVNPGVTDIDFDHIERRDEDDGYQCWGTFKGERGHILALDLEAHGDVYQFHAYWGSGGLAFKARRTMVDVPDYDTTVGKLSHVKKDSGGSLPTGLAKLGNGGELTAATPSSTGGANADYRDPKDATCYETKTKWTTESNIPTSWGEDWELRYDDGAMLYLLFVGGVNTNARYLGDSPGESDTVRYTQGSGDAAYGPYPERFDRTAICTINKPFVTFDVVMLLVNGVKTMLGTLASPFSTFAEWIASKLDRTSFADAYSDSASTTYAVGDVVDYNGVIYQCVAATSGGAFDASKWEERKLDDFFSKSGTSGRDLKNALLAEAIDVRTPYALTTGDPADRSIKVYNAASLPEQIPLPDFPTAGIIDLEVWIVETAGTDVTGVTFSKTIRPKDGKALEFAKSSTNIVHLTAVAGEGYYTAVAAAFAAETLTQA